MVRPTQGSNDTHAGTRDTLDHTVRLGAVIGFALLILLSFTKNVNWDEFYFLSHVHAFADGRLDRPLQTFFVHGFEWLTRMPGHEMEQILAARFVMIGFVCVTAYSVHRIAAHLTDNISANIAVLAFVTSGFVLPHGASFRADPIAAALLTSAIALILTTQMKLFQVVIAATLSALALLVTIKAALYAPAFLAALIWRWNDRGVALRVLFSGILTVAIFAILYSWHASGIMAAPGNETAANVHEAATSGLLKSGWFPRAPYIATWAILSVVPIVLAIIGLFKVRNARLAILLTLLIAPLLSVIIYRNAFPYFFPFATPLMMVAVAFGAQFLQRSALLARLVMIMLATGALQAALSLTEGKVAQRATIAEVHRLFPEPVAYIDDSSMVASFQSVGPFLSNWGMTIYRTDGRPLFGSLINKYEPPLLIANKQALIATMDKPDSGFFLPEDELVLRETYVHYNGAIWLAGREITLTQVKQQLEMPFAGQYRVSATAPITIDGQRVEDGDIIALGEQSVISGTPDTYVKLIWDTGAAVLDTELPAEAMYVGFWEFQL